MFLLTRPVFLEDLVCEKLGMAKGFLRSHSSQEIDRLSVARLDALSLRAIMATGRRRWLLNCLAWTGCIVALQLLENVRMNLHTFTAARLQHLPIAL